MSSRHHIDDFMRGRIIGKIEEGRKITDVAREFDIAHSVVSRLWKSFKSTGMCSRRHGEVVLEVRRLQKTDISSYINKKEQAHHGSAGGKSVSCCLRKADLSKTVARCLRGGGLYARRPVVCVPLTRQHRTARLQWCREHLNWTEQDWACVLFSDESRFSLSSDCRRQLIWRESGTAYRPENIQEKDRYPTCSIMVWAGIMINGRMRLHVVANGTMTGQRYIDEVLLPRVRLFRGAVGDKFVFMDDNATCHRTLTVQDCLDSEGIQRLVWPARSPDLNPIENVWDALGRQVAGRNYPPTNKNTLIRALTEEWDKLPQQLLDNVVQILTPEALPSALASQDLLRGHLILLDLVWAVLPFSIYLLSPAVSLTSDIFQNELLVLHPFGCFRHLGRHHGSMAPLQPLLQSCRLPLHLQLRSCSPDLLVEEVKTLIKLLNRLWPDRFWNHDSNSTWIIESNLKSNHTLLLTL
ncbi:transposable element Tcb2 transposase [Trichonephila clavipes]|nr:transposable element Tcb2 transposase [Trichonephila clavipes]